MLEWSLARSGYGIWLHKEWWWGDQHIYYDGPNCAWGWGFVWFWRSGGQCAECENTGDKEG